MAVVRELLVKLGFQTDQRQISNANRAILGFKTNLALLSNTFFTAFRALSDAFHSISTAVLDSDELARSLGITFKELQAIQQVISRFRINPEQLSGLFSEIKKDLNEFAQGFGRLPEIARKLKIEISRDTGTLDLFDQYIQKIRLIEDEQARIKVATDLFGDQLGVKIADLALRYDDFKESVAEAYDQLQKQPDILPQARAYEEAISKISEAWTRFFRTITTVGFPIIKILLDSLTEIATLFSDIINGFGSLISFGATKAGDFLSYAAEATGANKLPGFLGDLFGYDTQGATVTAPNVTNNIEISVPEGTTQEQAEYMSTRIQQAVDASVMNVFQHIQSNNPVVE